MHRSQWDRLYRIWKAIRSRCNNPNTTEYHRYGGRGIKVCEEWNSFMAFEIWAIFNGYSDNLTIDRVDNNKGYSPENCRWITLQEQQQTRSTCRMITYNGKTQNLKQWAKELGLCYGTLKRRVRLGKPFTQAIKGVIV